MYMNMYKECHISWFKSDYVEQTHEESESL